MYRILTFIVLLPAISCNKSINSKWKDCDLSLNFKESRYYVDSLGLEIWHPSKWMTKEFTDSVSIVNFFYEDRNNFTHITFVSMPPNKFEDFWQNIDKDESLIQKGKITINGNTFRYVLTSIGQNQFLQTETLLNNVILLQVLPQNARNQDFCETKHVLENITFHKD
ncbi:MAG: hypothetical protein KF803_14730 [Cyclobacteriaceae bacterium]|nr:hypothetical protein [Cyclobacteriaceae bacterium]